MPIWRRESRSLAGPTTKRQIIAARLVGQVQNQPPAYGVVSTRSTCLGVHTEGAAGCVFSLLRAPDKGGTKRLQPHGGFCAHVMDAKSDRSGFPEDCRLLRLLISELLLAQVSSSRKRMELSCAELALEIITHAHSIAR